MPWLDPCFPPLLPRGYLVRGLRYMRSAIFSSACSQRQPAAATRVWQGLFQAAVSFSRGGLRLARNRLKG